MIKFKKYIFPAFLFIQGCAYLNINRINPFSDKIYKKISGSSYTISMNKYQSENITKETLQSRINILSFAAQDQKKTLEQLCKELDKKNLISKDISDKEYNDFLDNYFKTK